MWGQQWGQMIWGGALAAAVPTIGFWGAVGLGVLLGVVGVRVLRRGQRSRTIGLAVLALAILIPLSVRAVPFTFANGTVADASQVNANFAAVTPVTGYFATRIIGALPAQQDVLTPTFTASRPLSCIVHINTRMGLNTTVPVGEAFVQAIQNQNGVVSAPTAPPSNVNPAIGMAKAALSAGDWTSAQTRRFLVASDATIQFGCRINTTGDFSSQAAATYCVTVYECF